MKRFYENVSVQSAGDGWQVMLDGRGIKSQGGSQQIVPSEKLAELLAGEWREQGEEIDPKSFVFRDMADYAIDVIRRDRDAAIANLTAFSQTDTLCYRADPETPMFERQGELWEPLVTACEAQHGVTFVRVSGIIHDPQQPETTERLTNLLAEKDEFQLAGLQTLTALAASIIAGLAALEDGADPDALFAAANAEEDWQAELWGWDAEAEAGRAMRLKAFSMAQEFAQAARG